MNKVKAENVALRFNAMVKHPLLSYSAEVASPGSYRVIQRYNGFEVGVALGARGTKKPKTKAEPVWQQRN